MTLSQAPPTGVRRLSSTIGVSGDCYSVSQHDTGIYVGVEGGVDLVTRDGELSRVISSIHSVNSVCLYYDEIYTLTFTRMTFSTTDLKNGRWSVGVYDSDYQLSEVWVHKDQCDGFNQLAVREESVLVPHRDSKTIIEYSLDGEEERRIPCPMLKDTGTWMCGMSSSRGDAVIVSSGYTVSCIEVSAGQCAWSTDSLEEPRAVCCDDAGRIYVAVGGYSDTLLIAVLSGKTGKTASFPACACQHLLVSVATWQWL